MAGFLCLLVYLLSGLYIMRVWLHDKSPLIRIWMGLSLGVLLLMWLPALGAFVVRFTIAAQGIGLLLLAGLVLLAALYQRRHRHGAKPFTQSDRGMAWALALFVLPMTLFMLYLQYTHTLRDVDGALHVGQSTYGDLMMHLSIITSLRGAALPSEYSMLPGAVLGYPILTDAMSTSLYMLGMPLRLSIILPGTLMTALVYAGFLLLAREMTGRTSAAVLAAALLFFNGGLGFLYHFDLAGFDTSKITEIFTGWYKTPPNQPDLNLRWSNLVVDMLLPQRTFLGGWTLLLPALYCTRLAFRSTERRLFLLAALFGAALPIVHTHSFLALALYGAGALLVTLIANPEKRRETAINAALYVGIVAALALPQLMVFTLQQASREGFLRFHFNWVNNTGFGLIDFYPWFWLKNIGLPLIAMLCALINFRKQHRIEIVGAALIFLVAETILFQPLEYDNNKLFYVWYLLMLPMAASFCLSLWDRMRGMRARTFIAALFVAASTLSGALSMAREAVSDYEIFNATDVKTAAFIEHNTPPHAVFLTGLRHENLVYALTGRNVVCGPENFLWTHGYGDEYYVRSAEIKAFYRNPGDHTDFLEKYGVQYILVSSHEWATVEPDEAALDAMFAIIFQHGSTKVYKVPDFTGSPTPEDFIQDDSLKLLL